MAAGTKATELRERELGIGQSPSVEAKEESA